MSADNDRPKPNSIPIIPQNVQRIVSRTIPGAVSPQNKGAIDWGWQGFLAYGAQTNVVIVDPDTLQCAQTLSKHRSNVVKVRWRKTRHYHQLSAPYSLTLASADYQGNIIIWDVAKGEARTTLNDANKPVQEIEWLGSIDGSEHLIAALHPPYSIIIWDTRHGYKTWKKSYTETLLSFHFDPFYPNKMAFLCQGCILFTEDFNLNKCPSSNGRKFYVSVPRSSPGRSSSIPSSASSSSLSDDKEKTSTLIKRKMRDLVVGESRPRGEDMSQLSECLQLMYHQTVRDQIILVYSREILILDLLIKQTVGIIALDRAISPFCQVMCCSQRDILYCLHESGSISMHFRRRLLPVVSSPDTKDPNWLPDGSTNENYYEVLYDRKCHSEPLRLSKNNRPIGLVMNPVTEKNHALVLGDGRVVFKDVTLIPTPQSINSSATTPIFTPSVPVPPIGAHSSPSNNSTSLHIWDNHFGASNLDNLTNLVKNPKLSLNDLVKPSWALPENIKDLNHRVNLRILLTGLMPSVAPPPIVLRMCPPLTTKNVNVYVHHLAVGTNAGTVQIFNLATGMLEKEFSLHTYPVKGIEWTSLTTLLSFGYQALTNSQGLVRNELMHTDIQTGHTIALRTNKSDESPIDMIRVSYLKQYFIVVFKEDPFELWDAVRLVPLRTMSVKMSKINALEWSPTSQVRPKTDCVETPDTPIDASQDMGKTFRNMVSSMSGNMSSSMSVSNMSLADIGRQERLSIIKESFIFTDAEGQLFNFSVEGNVIKDGSKVPPASQMSAITCIAWKSHRVVLGDTDGNLIIWDIKNHLTQHINTYRGMIKKMRFAPGRDNMKLLILFTDGVDIWDVKLMNLVSQLKTPKDCVKIIDVDWGASYCPVLATIEGCIRIMDMKLKFSESPMNQYCTKDIIVSPYLLNAETSINLRTMLTHQPWREKYSLEFSTNDGFTEEQLDDINILLSRISPEIKEYLINCESTAHRALAVAKIYGDQGEIDFWTVATHYLTRPQLFKSDGTNSSNSSVGSAELINLADLSLDKSGASEDMMDLPEAKSICPNISIPQLVTHPLETSYNYLCDSNTYKHHELERLSIHESKGLEGSQRDELGRRLAVIGERDRVVRLLLDTDSTNEQFYTDCLRACLLAATQHSTQAQSTIKLVATNLIAAGNIWEGVELLCVIGKAVDACRYLQCYSHWEHSVWLAKCVLPQSEATDLLKRWAHHLIHGDFKDLGVMVLISVGEFWHAIEQLVQQHYHQRAVLFLSAAQQLRILPNASEISGNATGTNTLNLPSSSPTVHSSSTITSLVENIYRKYILHLFSLNNRPAALHFANLLGEKGSQLLQELDVL